MNTRPDMRLFTAAIGLPAAATDPNALAEVMPLTARDLQLEVPTVTTTAPGAPSEVTPGAVSEATRSPRQAQCTSGNSATCIWQSPGCM